MHNFFLNQPPFNLKTTPFLVKLANRGLHVVGIRQQITPRLDPQVDMNSVEQRINMFHLLDGVLAYGVAGDVVELGCLAGQCAMLFQKVLEQRGSEKALHLFDSFQIKFTLVGSVEEALRRNFADAGLRQPTLHPGVFASTLPAQLPERIAFVHIDCGFGGDPQEHKGIVLQCLDAVYPRLSPGAVCCLMDYHDAGAGDRGMDANPGVKMACDTFLEGKPETVVALFGNQYSHGYFRKK